MFRPLTFASMLRRSELQTTEARVSGSEGKCMIQQYWIDLGLGVDLHLFDLRLGKAIPVLQCSVEVALQEICARQKIVGVRVRGIQPKCSSQVIRRRGILFLLEEDPGQFQRKAFVAGLLLEPLLKGPLSIAPALQMTQRYSVVIVKIRSAYLFSFCKPNDLLPTFFCKQLFDLS